MRKPKLCLDNWCCQSAFSSRDQGSLCEWFQWLVRCLVDRFGQHGFCWLLGHRKWRTVYPNWLLFHKWATIVEAMAAHSPAKQYPSCVLQWPLFALCDGQTALCTLVHIILFLGKSLLWYLTYTGDHRMRSVWVNLMLICLIFQVADGRKFWFLLPVYLQCGHSVSFWSCMIDILTLYCAMWFCSVTFWENHLRRF